MIVRDTDQQDRKGGAVQDLVGGRAKQRFADDRMAMGSHHNDISLEIGGLLDDSFGRLPFNNMDVGNQIFIGQAGFLFAEIVQSLPQLVEQ